MQLQGGGEGGGGVEWTDDPDEEVDTLHSFVRTFVKDLQTITKTIKQRTVLQIKTAGRHSREGEAATATISSVETLYYV